MSQLNFCTTLSRKLSISISQGLKKLGGLGLGSLFRLPAENIKTKEETIHIRLQWKLGAKQETHIAFLNQSGNLFPNPKTHPNHSYKWLNIRDKTIKPTLLTTHFMYQNQKKKIRERERELERRGPWQREAETSPSAYEGQPSSALPPALLRHLCLWLESDSSQTLSTKLSSRPIVRDRDKERELCIHIGWIVRGWRLCDFMFNDSKDRWRRLILGHRIKNNQWPQIVILVFDRLTNKEKVRGLTKIDL